MRMPGFTAERALSVSGLAYRQMVNALPDDNRARVFLAVKNNGPQSFQCCCGELCTSHLPCPSGCQQTCFCGNGYVLAICRCGPKTNAIGRIGGTAGQFMNIQGSA